MKNKVFRFGLGIVLMPLLYARYSFLIYMPVFIHLLGYGNTVADALFAWLILWFVHGVTFSFLMRNCEIMEHWLDLFIRVFNIKYNIESDWGDYIEHTRTIWRHPIINVESDLYKISESVSGLFEEEEWAFDRKIILIYFMSLAIKKFSKKI